MAYHQEDGQKQTSLWQRLPREIQLIVFELLEENHERNQAYKDICTTFRGKNGFARFSSVSKEWQFYFEQRLYRRLEISQSDLDGFGKFIGHRQWAFIEHICFHIELTSYDCSGCNEYPHWAATSANATIAEKAIRTLFSILSQWNIINGDGRVFSISDQLTLEMSMYSPSDNEHWFKGYLHLDRGAFDDQSDSDESPIHDPSHGWANDQRIKYPPQAALSRLHITLDPKFDGDHPPLPTVDVVKHFITRRQTRRNLSSPAMQHIFNSLPCLVSIDYEPWREHMRCCGQFYTTTGYYQDPGYYDLFVKSLSIERENLKTMTIFEDFNVDYDLSYWMASGMVKLKGPEFVRTPCPSTSAAMAWRSLRLEKFCASFIVEADEFFKARSSDWIWYRLKLLTLTSRLLTHLTPEIKKLLAETDTFAAYTHEFPSFSQDRINKMLAEAGSAALNMPCLEKMEIWNGAPRNACVLRYHRSISGEQPNPTLRWCGTWNLDLQPEVIDVWKRVAKLHSGRNSKLVVLPNQSLDQDAITSHASAIRGLKLAKEVIHPVSLEQIDRESLLYFHNFS